MENYIIQLKKKTIHLNIPTSSSDDMTGFIGFVKKKIKIMFLQQFVTGFSSVLVIGLILLFHVTLSEVRYERKKRLVVRQIQMTSVRPNVAVEV